MQNVRSNSCFKAVWSNHHILQILHGTPSRSHHSQRQTQKPQSSFSITSQVPGGMSVWGGWLRVAGGSFGLQLWNKTVLCETNNQYCRQTQTSALRSKSLYHLKGEGREGFLHNQSLASIHLMLVRIFFKSSNINCALLATGLEQEFQTSMKESTLFAGKVEL